MFVIDQSDRFTLSNDCFSLSDPGSGLLYSGVSARIKAKISVGDLLVLGAVGAAVRYFRRRRNGKYHLQIL